jgi:hypothetical protein
VGRPSTARMTLWCPDLEVGAAYQPDLAGGGGNFGRLSVAGRRVAADGEVWSGVSASGGLLGSAACRVSGGSSVHRRSWMGRPGGSLIGGGGVWGRQLWQLASRWLTELRYTTEAILWQRRGPLQRWQPPRWRM